MKPLKITIKDIPWTVQAIPEQMYLLAIGSDSMGVTDKNTREITLSRAHLSTELIRHELFHAYCSSCCIDSTHQLTTDDFEEIAAEIVGYHAEDICKTAKKLYNTLQAQITTEGQKNG